MVLAVLAPLAVGQTFTTLGFTVRGRMEGGGEGSGYGGLFHGGGRIYYQSASNDIQKRIDTAGTYQDLMDGTPVPPKSPGFDAPAYNKPYNFSEWQVYAPEGVLYYRLNNTDGTCTGQTLINAGGGPFLTATAPYVSTGATTSVEVDDADPTDGYSGGDLTSRVDATLWGFNQSCSDYVGSVDSALAAGPNGLPLRRTTVVSRQYNNHQSSQAWSTARFTDVRTGDSSTFYTKVNMDWVAYDIAPKFQLPAACTKAPAPQLDCQFKGQGQPCTGTAGGKFATKLDAPCLTQLFPDGAMFPAAPDENAFKSVEV